MTPSGAEPSAAAPPVAPEPAAVPVVPEAGGETVEPAVRERSARQMRLLALVEVGLRLAAGVIVTLLGVVFALLTAFLVPLRVGGVPVPLSFVAALVGNILLIRYARYATDSRLGIIGPVVAWLAVMLVFGSRTAEGDLVLTGDWRGLGTLFIGAVAFAIAGFLAVAPTPPRLTPPPAARRQAGGSGTPKP